MHLTVEVVEGGVRQPRLVEMEGADVAIQGRLDRFYVVDDSVVGALGQGEQARGRGLVADERVGLGLTVALQTILLEVDVPFVTK